MSIRFLKLSLASPDSIRSWTERILPNRKRVGKILKGDLIDYKNGLPIRDGLSCERIFGPMVSFTCTCGRFKCIETRGIHIVHDTLRSSRPILPDVAGSGSNIKVKQWDENRSPFKTDIFGSKIVENETPVHHIVSQNKISMTVQKAVRNEKPGKKKSTEALEFSILQPVAYRQKKMIRFLRDFYYDYEFTYHSPKNETVPSFVSLLKEPFNVTLTNKNSFKPEALCYYSKKKPIFQWFNLFFPMKSIKYKICSKGDPIKTNLLLKTDFFRIQNLLKPLYKFLFQVYTRFWFDLKVNYNNFIYEKHIFLWMPNRSFKTSKVYHNFKVHSSFFSQLKIQGLRDKSQKLPITNKIFCNETSSLNSNRSDLPFWLKNSSLLTKILQNNTLQKTNSFFSRAIKTQKTCNIWYHPYLLPNASNLKSFCKDPKYSYLLFKNFSSYQLVQRYTDTDQIWKPLYCTKLINNRSILFWLKKNTVNTINQKFDLKIDLREKKNVSLKTLTAFTLYDHKKSMLVKQESPNRGKITNILYDFRKISRLDLKQGLSNPFQKLLFTLKKNRNLQNTAWIVLQSSVLANRENKNSLSVLSNKTDKSNKNKELLKPVSIFDFFKKQENSLFQSNKEFYSNKAHPLLNSGQKQSALSLSYSRYQSPQIEKTFFPKKVETVNLNSAPITHNEDILKSSVGSNTKQNIRVYKFKNFPPEEIRYCPYCEVELLPNSIRRYRLGYIEFVSPVAHIWYTANSIPLLLNLSKTIIEGIASCHEALSSGFPPVYKWSYNGESPTSWTFQMQPLRLPINPIPKMVPINEISEIGTVKKSHFTETVFGFNSTTGLNSVRPRTTLPLLYSQKSKAAVFSIVQSTETSKIASQKFVQLLTSPFRIVSYNLTPVPSLCSENDLKIYERRIKSSLIKNTNTYHKEQMSKSKKEELLYHDLHFFNAQIDPALNDFNNNNFKIFNSKNNTKEIGKKTLIKSRVDSSSPDWFWKDISYKFKYLWMFEYDFDKSLPKNSWFTPISSKVLPNIANGFEKQEKERPRLKTLYAKHDSKTLPLHDNLSDLVCDFSPNFFKRLRRKTEKITEAMKTNSKTINLQNAKNHTFLNQKKMAKQFFFMCLFKNNGFNHFFLTIKPLLPYDSFFHLKLFFHNKKTHHHLTDFISYQKKIEITHNNQRAKNKRLRLLPIVGTLHLNRLFSQFLLKSFKKEYISKRNNASMLSTESQRLFFRRASLLKSKPLNRHISSSSYKWLGKNAQKQMSGSACRFTPSEAMGWNPAFEYPIEKWLSVKDKSLFSFQAKLVSFFNISNETMREFSFFNEIPKKVDYDSDLYTATEYEKKREWLKLEGFFDDPSNQKLPDDSQASAFDKSKTDPLLDSQETKTDYNSRVKSKTETDISNQKHLKSENETREKNENDFQSFENLSLPLVLPFLGKNPDNIEFQSNYSNYENFNLDPLKFITDLFSTQHVGDYTDTDYNHDKDTYKLQTEENHNLGEIFLEKKQDNNDISNNIFNTYHDHITLFSDKYMPSILYNNQTVHKNKDLIKKSYRLNKLQCNFSLSFPPYQSNQENGFWPSLNRFYMMSDHLFSKTRPFLAVNLENSLFQDLFKPTKKENLFLGLEGVQRSLENLDTEDFKLPKNDSLPLPLHAWNLNRLNNQIGFNLSNFTNYYQNYQNCFRKLGRNSYYFRLEQMTRLENENAFLKNLFYRKIFQKTSIFKNGFLVLPFISVSNFHSINRNNKIRLKSNILQKKNHNFLIEKRTRFLFGFYLNIYDGFNFFQYCLSKIKYSPFYVKTKNEFFSSVRKYNFPSNRIFNKIKNKFGININKKYFTASIKIDKSFWSKNNFKNSLWPLKSNTINSYQKGSAGKLYIDNFYTVLHKSVENLHRPWCYFKNTLPSNFLNQPKPTTINSKIGGPKWPYQTSLNYLQHNWFPFWEMSQNYASFQDKRWSLKLEYLLKNKYFDTTTFYGEGVASGYKWLKAVNTKGKRSQFFFWTPNSGWQLKKQKSIHMGVPISMIYDLIISRSYFFTNSTPSLQTKQIENKSQWFEDLEILYTEKRLKKQYFSALSVIPTISFENLWLKTCYKSNHIALTWDSIYHSDNSSHDMKTLSFLIAKKRNAFKIMALVNFKKPYIKTLNKHYPFVNTKGGFSSVLELHKHWCFEVKPYYFFKYVQTQSDPKKGIYLNKQYRSIFKNFKHHYFSKAWQSLKQKVNVQPNRKISFSAETIKVKQQLNPLALLGFSTTQIEFFGSLKIYAKRRFLAITHHPSQNLKNNTGFLFNRFKNFKLKTGHVVNQKHLYTNLINGSFFIIAMNKIDYCQTLPFSFLESAQYPSFLNAGLGFINGPVMSVLSKGRPWLQTKEWSGTRNFSLSFSTSSWLKGRFYSTVSQNFFKYVNKECSLTKERQTKTYINKSFLVWLNLYQNQQKIILPGKKLPFLINIKTGALNRKKKKVSSRIIKYLSLNNDYHSSSSRLAKLLIDPYTIANSKRLSTMKRHKTVICYAYAIETIQNKKQIPYSKILSKNFKDFESGSKRLNNIKSLSSKMSCFSYGGYSPIASLNLGNKLIIPKKSTYQPKIIVQKIPKQIPLLGRFEQTPCVLKIRNGYQSTFKSSIFDVLGPQSLRVLKSFKTPLGSFFVYPKEKSLFLRPTKNIKHINGTQSKYNLNVQVVNLGIFKDSSYTQIFKWGNRGHIFVFDKLTKNSNYHNYEIPYRLKKPKHNSTKNTKNTNQGFLVRTDTSFPSTNYMSEKSFQNRLIYSGSLVNEKQKSQAWKGNTNYYACISQITSWGSDHGSWILFLKYIRANIYKGDQLLPLYFNKMNFQMMPRTGSIMLQQLLRQLVFIPKALDKSFSPTGGREPYSISKQKSVPEIATWQKFATNRKRENYNSTSQFKKKTDHNAIVGEVIDHYSFHYDSSFFSSQTPGGTNGNKSLLVRPNQFLKGHKYSIDYKTFSLFNGLVFFKKNLQKAIEIELSNSLIKKPSFLSNNNCTHFSTIGLNTDYILKALTIKKNASLFTTNLFRWITNKTKNASSVFTLKTKEINAKKHSMNHNNNYELYAYKIKKPVANKRFRQISQLHLAKPINNWYRLNHFFSYSQTTIYRRVRAKNQDFRINKKNVFDISRNLTITEYYNRSNKKKIYEPYLDTAMTYFNPLINNDVRILKLIYSLIVSSQLQFLPINQRNKQYNYSLPNHKELFNPLFSSEAFKVSSKTINKSLTHKIFNSYYHIYTYGNNNLKHELCSSKFTLSNLSNFLYSQKPHGKDNSTISNGKTFDECNNFLLQNSLWLRSHSIKSKEISRFFKAKPRSLKNNNFSYLPSDSAYSLKKSQATLGTFYSKKNKMWEPIQWDPNLERKKNYTKSVFNSHYHQNYLENFYFSNQKTKIYNFLISPFQIPKSRFFNFNLATTPFDFVNSKSNRTTLNSPHKSRKSLKSLLPLKSQKWSYNRPLRHFISYIRLYNDNVSNFCFNQADYMKEDLYNSQKNTFTNNKNWLEAKFKSVLPVNLETYKGRILSETLFIKLKEIGNYNLLMKKKSTLFKTLILKMNSSLRPLLSETREINENQIPLPKTKLSSIFKMIIADPSQFPGRAFFKKNYNVSVLLTETKPLSRKLVSLKNILNRNENTFYFDHLWPKENNNKQTLPNLKPKYASRNNGYWVDLKKENAKASALEFFRIWLFLDSVCCSPLYSFNNFQSDYKINPTLITNKLPSPNMHKIREPQYSNFFSKILQFYEYRKNFLLKKIFKQRVRLTQHTAWKPSILDQNIALKIMPTVTRSLYFFNHLSKFSDCRENYIGDQLILTSPIFDVKPTNVSFLNSIKWLILVFSQKNKFKIWLEAYRLLTRNINIFYDQERSHNIKYEFKTFGPQIKHNSSYSDSIKSFEPQIYHLKNNTTAGSFKNEMRFRLLRVPKIFDLSSTPSLDPSGWFSDKTNLERNYRKSLTNQNHLLSIMQKKNAIPINIFGPLIFSSSIKPLKKKIKQWPKALPVLKSPENQPFWGTSNIFDYDFQKSSRNIINLDHFHDPISNSKKFEFNENENTQLKVSNNDYNNVFDERFNNAPIYHETFLNPDLPLSSEILFRKENLKVSSSYKALLQKAKILEDYPVPNPDPLDSKSIYLRLLNGDCAHLIRSNLKANTILFDKLPLFGTRFVPYNKNVIRPCLYSQKNTEANRINWGTSKNSITNTSKLLFRFLWDGNQNRFKNISPSGLNNQSRDAYWVDSKKEKTEANSELKLDNLSRINKKTVGPDFINKTKVPSKNVFSMRDQTKLKNETMTNLNDGTSLSVFHENRSSDNTNSISEPKRKSGDFFKNQEISFTGQKQVDLEKRKDTFTDLVKNSKSSRNNTSLHYGRNLRKLRLQYLRNFRRLRFIEYLKATYIKPEWMILSLLPVLPPDLRPVIANPRGYITGDINTHYQNVIYRNNNIEKLLDTFWIPRKFYSKTSFIDHQKMSSLMFSSIRSYFYSMDYLPVYQKENSLGGLKNRYFISKFFSKLAQFPVTFLYENKPLVGALFIKRGSSEKAPMSIKDNEWLISFPNIDLATRERKPINKSVKVLQSNVLSTPTNNVFYKTPLASVFKDKLTVSKNIKNTNSSVFKRLPFKIEALKHNELVKKPFSFLINRLLFSNLIVFNDISQSNLNLSVNNEIGVDQNPKLIHSISPKEIFGSLKKSAQIEQLFKNSQAKVIDWKLERFISPMFSKFTTPCWQSIENEPSMLKHKLAPSFENFQIEPSSYFFSKKTRRLILFNNEPLQQDFKNEQNNFFDQANRYKLHTKNVWFHNANQSPITENLQKYKKVTSFHLYKSLSHQEDYFYKPLLKLYNHASFFGSNIGIATGYNEIVQTFRLKTLHDESAFAKSSEISIKKSSVLALKTKIIRTQALHDSKPLQEMQYSLQKAVDALIDNSQKLQSNILLRKGRPLKSLSDNLKGKEGRFRQHLLGKRVDYSGRSVIVVGPDLKLYECGIPLIMALRLFQPFLILYLIYRFKIASLLATQLIQRKHPMVINLLKKFIETWPILLNRAPTLHRMNIQAFKIRLVQGKAILLHPLVCSSYNADFDGDQMGVHVPITQQARAESWKLLWSINNSIAIASRQPLFLPSQDMVIGNYYLTAPPIDNSLTFLIPKKRWSLNLNVENKTPLLYEYSKFDTKVLSKNSTLSLDQKSTVYYPLRKQWYNDFQKNNHYFFSLEEAYQYYLNIAYRLHINTPVWFRFCMVFETSEHEKPIEITLDKQGNTIYTTKFYEKQLKRNRIVGKNAFYFNIYLNSFITQPLSKKESIKPLFKNSIQRVDKGIISPSQIIFNKNLRPILLNQLIRSTFGRIEFYYEAFQASRLTLTNNN